MAIQLFYNNASTTLTEPMTAAQTTMQVASGAYFAPSLTNGDWMIVTLQRIVGDLVTQQEVVKVTAVVGLTWTIVRAQEGFSPLPWEAGDTVAMLYTAGTADNFIQVQQFYPPTLAESNAGVVPTNYFYPQFDPLRYGGNNAGTADNSAAFAAMMNVLLQNGGGVVRWTPGTYILENTITSYLTSGPPNSETLGIFFSAFGVKINFTGSGPAFDLYAQNSQPTFGSPWFGTEGLNIVGTNSGACGIRTTNVSSQRHYATFISNFTAGVGFIIQNASVLGSATGWSENDHYIGCGVVDCSSVMQFINPSRTSAFVSFSRTQVDGMFGAGITGPWFIVGGGCSVYCSRFTHLSGNYSGTPYFQIGDTVSDADMTGTVIDGIDTEVNSLVMGAGVFRLMQYPDVTGTARRPILVNPGTYSTSFDGAFPITFASPPSGTNVNMPIVWTFATAILSLTFSDSEVREATFTNNQAEITWSGALTGTPTTSATINDAIAVPLWTNSAGVAIASCESLLLQPCILATGSSTFETNPNVLANRTVATQNSITFTATLSGFSGTAPSGRVVANRSGNLVTLQIEDPLSGTSNANTMTLSGIPLEFQPNTQRNCPVLVEDNGNVFLMGLAVVNPSGASPSTITFLAATAFNAFSSTAFTPTGAKGIASAQLISYSI